MPETELVYHESWRDEIWDDDVPSRPGWQVRCSECGILKPDWTYAEERTAKQVATRHRRSSRHAASSPPAGAAGEEEGP